MEGQTYRRTDVPKGDVANLSTICYMKFYVHVLSTLDTLYGLYFMSCHIMATYFKNYKWWIQIEDNVTIYVCIGIHKYVYADNVFNVSIFFMKIICQKKLWESIHDILRTSIFVHIYYKN